MAVKGIPRCGRGFGKGLLDSQLRAFWELESLGIAENESTVQDSFKDTFSFSNGRYQVALPWKETHATLSSNRPQCARRLQGLLHRLKQIPALLSEYDSLIKDQFQKGVIEKVSDETTNQSSKVYYMPHHTVMREDKKTTKLRVVYDASAKADGTSLNDCLYAGPKYDQNIFGIILRFRLHRTALVADIEKAFLQVSVIEKDRDALRFLWLDDVNKSEPDIVSFRFTRIPFGVTSSPYLLNATVQHHLNRHSTEFPDVVQEISRSIYVDDVAFGADNDDLAYELYSTSKSILKRGGFNLRKFLNNSKDLQRRIDDTESQSQNISLPNPKQDGVCTRTREITKVLGVKWDPDDDSLLIDLGDNSQRSTEPRAYREKRACNA